MHAAENAVLAKVRAMYARRLTAGEYRDLLACHTVGEAAAYLKEKTPYGPYLRAINPANVHREWLEERLRSVLDKHFEALSRYACAINAQIYQYFVVEQEVAHLPSSLPVTGISGRNKREKRSFSAFFRKHSSVDWAKLEQAINLEQWLRALEGSPYQAVCRPFVDPVAERVDMVALDRALASFKMRRLLQLADAAYDHGEEKALQEQLRMRIDLNNLVGLYRAGILRRQQLVANSAVITDGGLLTDKQLKQLIAAPDEAAFQQAVDATRYKGVVNWQRDGYIELSVERYMFRQCQHQLRFTTFPSVALLSYAALRQMELNNIVHIIEAIRYGMAEAATDMLVGAEELR